ncbi:MAG: RNA polymerase subunit sigma-70 [Faecalicatena sp.]|uniref:RNA polymerase subunit sigma-70 n=1 Tax=Faecalicatena sp. TaxID=2005360 RepID=UPI00258AF999|nr:RNA polymerase subunit sigma-70 [Faecalicatena sp.]MCI6467462.1 RNA polymerase subunit sigma-70 [Faecalicatena sp.]MDY5618162.1 RNA polymerase subunit sigma-70 [Lachnospiraceae bacterium]
MDKKIIYEYVDAKELVKETEEDIRKHRKSISVKDKVRGSNPEFPYNPQSFNISGLVEENINMDEEEKILEERRANAKKIKIKAEKVINTASVRMQRIIRFRIMRDLTWNEVAERMGGNCTGDSVRKEFENFMKKK